MRKTTAQMADLLRREVKRAGSLRKWCDVHNITPSLASQFLRYGPTLPPALAAALGYERHITYVRTKRPND